MLAVISFTLEDAPESFHWPIVDALGHTGHTLRHAGLLQLVMEGSVGVLKASVAMKQRMSVRIGFYGSIKGFENQRIVIPITYHIGNNATVIEIQDRTEIDLMHLYTLIPFEFCYIGKPFLIRLARMEAAVKKILRYVLRILCMPCAAVIVVLDGGLDAFDPADAKNALFRLHGYAHYAEGRH